MCELLNLKIDVLLKIEILNLVYAADHEIVQLFDKYQDSKEILGVLNSMAKSMLIAKKLDHKDYLKLIKQKLEGFKINKIKKTDCLDIEKDLDNLVHTVAILLMNQKITNLNNDLGQEISGIDLSNLDFKLKKKLFEIVSLMLQYETYDSLGAERQGLDLKTIVEKFKNLNEFKDDMTKVRKETIKKITKFIKDKKLDPQNKFDGVNIDILDEKRLSEMTKKLLN